MTWGFLYVLVFLGGFTLALVTGLVRRLLHPTELCSEQVIVPSAEHWHSHHSPIADTLISFATVFGLTTTLVHGLTSLDPVHEIAIGLGGGIVGVVVLRTALGRICDPIHDVEAHPGSATVIRDIPEFGFGQVEISVGDLHLKLAAKSATGARIPSGTVVEILDRQESVVVVAPTA